MICQKDITNLKTDIDEKIGQKIRQGKENNVLKYTAGGEVFLHGLVLLLVI